jgi:shikimate dehydrogenase
MDISEINGATLLYAILGDPVEQVSTPGLINRIFSEKDQNKVLLPLHVKAESLKEVVSGLRSIGNFQGGVITMPHKKSIIPLLNAVSQEVEQTQACNVIRRTKEGKLHGHMLDGEGFITGLKEKGHKVQGRNVFLMGAGGAASGIAFALCRHGAEKIQLYNRSKDKAEELLARLKRYYPKVNLTLADQPDKAVNILINATSLGMREKDTPALSLEGLSQNTLVAEVIIRPELTCTLREAAQKGCTIHPGIHMLEAQIRLMLNFMEGSYPIIK